MDFTRTEAGLQAKEIDGHTYEFAKWGAEESLSTLLDIGTIIGKPLGAAAGRLDMESLQDRRIELPVDAIGIIVEHLAGEVGTHKKLAMSLIKRLATTGILCDGKAIAFDLHYRARLPHMLDVVAAAVEVQYGSFFGGAFAALRLKRAPSSSPKDSPSPKQAASSGAPS